jgi:hypothetical protein
LVVSRRYVCTRSTCDTAFPISGSLQLLGAAGVVIDLTIEPIGVAAASGLCVMMTLGVVVRMRMHDTFRVMVPAASLAVINGALVVLFVAG